MDRFLPFPALCRSIDDSNQAAVHSLRSSSSSLTSEVSLQSIPSLTPPSHAVEHHSADHHHCILTLKAHFSFVYSLALSGKHLYSGDSDGNVRLWDRKPSSYDSSNGYTVAGGDSAVKSIVVLGDKLFTAHQDHKVRVWKIENSTPQQKYKLYATLPTMNDRCVKLLSSKNYVKIRKHKKRTWVHHVDAVSDLTLSKDGSLLYSVSWDRTLKVWRTSDLKCLESVQEAHVDAINAVVVSGDGYVYTGSADRKIKVWKKRDGEGKLSLISTLEKHKSAVNALALSSDGSVLYSGACDRSIVVWAKDGCTAHMVVAGALKGHTKPILCLIVVADLLCSGSADGTVRIWRGAGRNYSCLATFEGHRSPVKCLAAAVDNGGREAGRSTSYLIYSGSLDFELKVWQISIPFSQM